MVTMRRGCPGFTALMGLGAAAWAAASVHAAGPQRSTAAADPASAGGPQLVSQYCVGCHNDRSKVRGLSLERVGYTDVGPDANVWERGIRKLQSGPMPPAGRPRPDVQV